MRRQLGGSPATGLGEGGLGEGGAKREGARDSEEARPPKQPKGTAKKAQRIERLTRGSLGEDRKLGVCGRPRPDAAASGIGDGAAGLSSRPCSDSASQAGSAQEALAPKGVHAGPQEGQASCGPNFSLQVGRQGQGGCGQEPLYVC